MPKLSIAPEVQPPRSHLLVLLAVLVLVLSSSLYYYLRVTSPELFTNLRLPTYDLQSTISNLRSTFRFLRPSPSPQNQVGPAQRDNNLAPSKPPYTIPSGPQTYKFSHGKNVVGPKPQSLTIDPLDPALGSTQTITLEVDSDSPIQTVTVTLQTDHGDKPLTLALKSGDTLRGTYQTSHQADDTFDQQYALHYLLTSTSGTFDNIMYIR